MNMGYEAGLGWKKSHQHGQASVHGGGAHNLHLTAMVNNSFKLSQFWFTYTIMLKHLVDLLARGVPAVRARSLAPASLRLVHDTLAITLPLSHPRSDVPTLPFVRGSPTRVAPRSASPAHPSCDSARRSRSGCIAPRPVYPLRHTLRGGGWAGRTDPLASPRERGRGGVRKRRAGVARAEGVDAPTLPLACAGGWAGVARAAGWAHRPSPCVRGRGGAGRAVRPLAYAGRVGHVGLGWRGPRGGVGAPSLLSRMWAGRGAWGWAGVAWAEGDWGGRAVLRAPAGRGRGDVPSCAPFPRERGGADKGEGADVSSFRAEGGCWGEGRDRGAAAGPRAPYLRAKGEAAVNAGDGRRRGGASGDGKRDLQNWVVVRAPVAEASRACHGPELDPSPLQYPSVPIPLSSRLPPPSSTSSPSPVTAATFARKGGTREYGARGPAAAPRSLPSPQHPPSARKEDTSAPSPLSAPPRSRGKGAHEGTSPRPLPAGARRTARPPQSPSAQATPAQPHTPRPARIRERRDGAPTPPRGPRQPNPTCPALPAYARGRMARPAPPRPRTQGEGRCAHPAARATPAQPPAHARGRVGASTPSARATPARRLRTPPRPRSLGDARGSVRPAQPPPRGVCYPSPPGLHTPGPRRGVCKGEGRTHAKGVHGTRGDATRARAASGVARRVCGRGGAGRNPGGGATHERKGGHIGARVRKGESDGEGVVNEAKRSRGEAARANGGHPPRQ
ncbi:hypothetical protein EDB85DRAFT_1893550 [Lactarius pseudohatsudake]|nr:hypothetical protein EDB85DRAFT_1893550 [Lactarius pseudohatsudake]